MSLHEDWIIVQNKLESEMTAVHFDLWIKPLSPIFCNGEKIVLLANSEMCKNQCLNNHLDLIKSATKEVFKDVTTIEIVTENEKDKYVAMQKELESVSSLDEVVGETKEGGKINLNPKYTFDNFVVGKSNQFVYAAARAVAENPSSKFNPLFIYGGVGLGKTHLLHAIGNYIAKNNSEKRIMYITCEKFCNDYIDAIRSTHKDTATVEFRDKYRNVDVLLVDDIQFISNKKETQENFFHTFNDLYQSQKQIVLASDRPPKDIENLTDRLVSRFSSGLIQDIQEPDFETKVAILRKKSSQESFNVQDDVIEYIAQKPDTNIRELEGMLAKVVFYANLMGNHFPSVIDAKNALKDGEKEIEKQVLSEESIINVVCSYYHVSKENLIGKKRNKELVDPRQMSMYLMSELLTIPLSSIGAYFGGRDHTTVMHARDKICDELKTNAGLRVIVSDLKKMITDK